ELVVYSLFALAFAGTLLLSVLLGRFIGRRVVTPILSLADAVRADSAELPLLDRGDELGVLARAFAAHTAELRGFLERERFFTGDVSHELRTPLTVITGAAEILVVQGASLPHVAAPAERILRAANEAAECVKVLLMLARSPERMPHAASDIAAIAERETARYQSLVAGKDVRLVFEGGPSFFIDAAPELCGAAIGNLVRNACQYTERGDVTVHVAEGRVLVQDTGPGLPPAALSAFSGVAGNAGPSLGTGLGLGLVRRICQYLGAGMEVRQREGGGTVFEISFPAALTKS
ncbi:MAG: HAMP domain-containing histidine kinase, partial [Bdellovibrionales bacterium]|nr:HAMP domain-containing histidine kinase [Massilia sp.]